jgi:3',5'-cyclic-AMP phosphodiesterase
MAYRLIWVTDPHLEFLAEDADRKALFLEELGNTPGEAVLITGDVSNAANLEGDLELLAQLNKPIYFLLGNHDFYGGSMAGSIDLAQRAAKRYPEKLIYLDAAWTIRLTDRTKLIGVNGFADGLSGRGPRTRVRLSDFFHIENFASLQSDVARFNLMRTLAQAATDKLRRKLIAAAADSDRVIVATHVPPFVDSSFHAGQVGSPEYLPFFSCPTMGQMLLEIAEQFPRVRYEVFAGHTHSPAPLYEPVPNLSVEVDGAEYGSPKISKVLEAR